MLRIGVVSDSHGSFRNLERLRELCGRLDWLLHAGDFLCDAAPIAETLGVDPERVRAVAGNCDFPVTRPGEVLEELEGVRLYLVHGHQLGVKTGLHRIHLRAQEVGARVAIFGHTHVPVLADVGGVMLLKPGSLAKPRLGEPPSAAVLEVAGGEVRAEQLFLG